MKIDNNLNNIKSFNNDNVFDNLTFKDYTNKNIFNKIIIRYYDKSIINNSIEYFTINIYNDLHSRYIYHKKLFIRREYFFDYEFGYSMLVSSIKSYCYYIQNNFNVLNDINVNNVFKILDNAYKDYTYYLNFTYICHKFNDLHNFNSFKNFYIDILFNIINSLLKGLNDINDYHIKLFNLQNENNIVNSDNIDKVNNTNIIDNFINNINSNNVDKILEIFNKILQKENQDNNALKRKNDDIIDKINNKKIKIDNDINQAALNQQNKVNDYIKSNEKSKFIKNKTLNNIINIIFYFVKIENEKNIEQYIDKQYLYNNDNKKNLIHSFICKKYFYQNYISLLKDNNTLKCNNIFKFIYGKNQENINDFNYCYIIIKPEIDKNERQKGIRTKQLYHIVDILQNILKCNNDELNYYNRSLFFKFYKSKVIHQTIIHNY